MAKYTQNTTTFFLAMSGCIK